MDTVYSGCCIYTFTRIYIYIKRLLCLYLADTQQDLIFFAEEKYQIRKILYLLHTPILHIIYGFFDLCNMRVCPWEFSPRNLSSRGISSLLSASPFTRLPTTIADLLHSSSFKKWQKICDRWLGTWPTAL